jgi:hypothetical protein
MHGEYKYKERNIHIVEKSERLIPLLSLIAGAKHTFLDSFDFWTKHEWAS